MDAGLGDGDDTTPRELVHFIIQQTRFSLISDIRYFPSGQQIVTTDEITFSENVWLGDDEISLPTRHCSYGF